MLNTSVNCPKVWANEENLIEYHYFVIAGKYRTQELIGIGDVEVIS